MSSPRTGIGGFRRRHVRGPKTFIRRQRVAPELFLPRVVDARDGTIRPLAVPDNASANLPVTQTGTGRIWIGTAPDGHDLGEEEDDVVQVAGFAYSDDGGATWTEVTIPAAALCEAERLATKDPRALSIAADGDRIAVTSPGRTTRSICVRLGRRRHELVDRDRRESLRRLTGRICTSSPTSGCCWCGPTTRTRPSSSCPPARTGPRWRRFRSHPSDHEDKYVSVNRDGIALMYFPVEMYDDGNDWQHPGRAPHPGTLQYRPDELADDCGTRRLTG